MDGRTSQTHKKSAVLAVGGGEHLAGEVGNVSVYTALRRKAADDMNVGGPHGARLLNELIQ